MTDINYDTFHHDLETLIDKHCGDEPEFYLFKQKTIGLHLFIRGIYCCVNSDHIDPEDVAKFKKIMREGMDICTDKYMEDKK